MPPRQLKLPIPVTILTGSLGVGKTTAVCSLVAQKPPEEVWCCIVNEFGAVGIDAVAIKGSASEHGNVVVKQLAGGCMCCVLSGPLSAAIAQIIRQVKPDRVILEPSGLGHPGGLIDILQGPNLCTALSLNAVLCLVDLTTFDPASLMTNSISADQITVADILIGSKADAAAPTALEAFQQWADAELFPPKAQVLTICNGALDTKWLDEPRTAAAGQLLIRPKRRSRSIVKAQLQQPLGLAADQQAYSDVTSEQQQGGQGIVAEPGGNCNRSKALPGQPVQVIAAGGGQSGQYISCGWVFHQDDVFDQLLLLQFLQDVQPMVARVKGVFRIGAKQWVAPTTVPAAPEQQEQQSNNSQPSQQATQQQQSNNSQPSQQATQQQQSYNSQQAKQQQPSEARQVLWLRPICYRGASMIEVILQADSSDRLTKSTLGELQEQLLRTLVNVHVQQ